MWRAVSPLRYPNIPVQPLVKGGSFAFDLHYDYPQTIPSGWELNTSIKVIYEAPNGTEMVNETLLQNMNVDGLLTHQEIIPTTVSKGTSVYLQKRR